MDINELGEIAIFNDDDGEVRVQIDAVNETIWMTQKGIADLFGVDRSVVTKHLKNIIETSELQENSVCAFFAHTAEDGKTYNTKFYNLDAIIAVGYRINSKRATQFRIWATKTLRDYMVKGYALDSERFKNGQSLTYFKELLEKIREIRISERLFYQQVKDIFSLSVDYDKESFVAKEFFAKVQNKLLWAVSGKTAAELIYYRCNHELPMMGLTSTQTANIVRKTDTTFGKNYLNKEELEILKLIVEQYLAFAETQAKSHTPMTMNEWVEKLDIVLSMNKKNILTTKGKISKALADEKAHKEFEIYKQEERMRKAVESIKEFSDDINQARKDSKKDKPQK